LKWKFFTGKDITATPTIYNGIIYFPCWNGNIYAIKEYDGSLVWKQNLGKLTGLNTSLVISNVNGIVARATPTIAKDLLIIGIYGPCVVIGLKITTGELVWMTRLDSHPTALITMSGTYYNGLVQIHFLFLSIYYGFSLCHSMGLLARPTQLLQY
jgi:outer membrane protein assembly factor BamB